MRHLNLIFLLLMITAPAVAAENPYALGVPQALGLGTNGTAPRAATMPVPPAVAVPVPVSVPQLPPTFDYSVNLNSEVFGAQLFTGSFARQGVTPYNPDYTIGVGDHIQVRLWGGLEYDTVLVVDPQGNIFLPQVGPVKVLGTTNQNLQRVVQAAMRKVFRSNVFCYASLAAAQPVRVFVGGYVYRPGLYNGTSTDSLLQYLDQAGGIDANRGSFLNVQVKRGEQQRADINLYDFLLKGKIPLVQLADGDVIFIPARRNTVKVAGLAENAKRFEFKTGTLPVAELAELAKPKAQATHVRVVRNTGTVKNVEYYSLADAQGVRVGDGDEVEFTADKKPGTITVRVEGEHQSAQEYVLPYGTRFGELMKKIEFSERSDEPSLQLFRLSVRERQKTMLQAALKSLETTVLTARSGTSDEARLRKDEAELILQWVDRARKIEPSGQVLIGQAEQRDELLLENGDIVKVPSRDGLVLISGEVLFPNAIAHDRKMALEDYIKKAGGFTQNADNSRIVVAHRDGSFVQGEGDTRLKAGDEVLVLPKVDVKSRQIWKDMTQIIYQIAVSAKVVFGL
jgi:protein involved in polysaccharide export with SLBB domain